MRYLHKFCGMWLPFVAAYFLGMVGALWLLVLFNLPVSPLPMYYLVDGMMAGARVVLWIWAAAP